MSTTQSAGILFVAALFGVAQWDLSVKPAEMGALVLRPASKESPAQIGCSKQNKCENGPKPRSNEGKTKAWIILMGLSN